MDDQPIICCYVFNRKEYRAAFALYQKHSLFKSLRTIGIVFLVLATLLSFAAYSDYQAAPASLSISFLYDHYVPLVVLIGVIGFLYFPFGSFKNTPNAFLNAWLFKRFPSFNQPITSKIKSESISSKTPLLESEIKWEGFARGRENRDGFILFLSPSQRQFVWLPKHGFESPNDVDCCRAKLHQHIKDFG